MCLFIFNQEIVAGKLSGSLISVTLVEMTFFRLKFVLQLNEYETAPYFIQFSQNLTCYCLLISVFSPEFPQIYLS